MTRAERAIKEASERASAYKYDISKYPILASGKTNTKTPEQALSKNPRKK